MIGDYGICLLSVVPGRAEPAHKSEMVTQLLYGETYTVLEQQGNWIKIVMDYDSYVCWIDVKQHTPLSVRKASYNQVVTSTFKFKDQLLSLGSMLDTSHSEGFTRNFKTIELGRIEYFAFLFLNTPYLWGGKSQWGIDCSGFTQLVFKMCGIALLRDAAQQATQGISIDFKDLKTGDLVFFCDFGKALADQKITHVGLVMNQLEVIHASGKVRVDVLDKQGILNAETGLYSHQYLLAKRIMV